LYLGRRPAHPSLGEEPAAEPAEAPPDEIPPDPEAQPVQEDDDEPQPARTSGMVRDPELKPFDPLEQTRQLAQLLQSFVSTGLIEQRRDGSLMVPGMQRARLRPDSACACARCTQHNQFHWVCMMCESVHEWVMVNDRPITMRQVLGDAGRAGSIHLVCSNACALGYKQAYGGSQMSNPMLGNDRPYPIAGGDDPLQFYMNQGAAA
jgi:hypothetical protein